MNAVYISHIFFLNFSACLVSVTSKSGVLHDLSDAFMFGTSFSSSIDGTPPLSSVGDPCADDAPPGAALGEQVVAVSAVVSSSSAASTSMADILSYRTCLPRSVSGSGEVRDWWREQVGYDSGTE